jgi:hypothetical protein
MLNKIPYFSDMPDEILYKFAKIAQEKVVPAQNIVLDKTMQETAFI